MKKAAHLLLLVQVEAHLTQALPDGPMAEPAVSSDQVTVNEANSNVNTKRHLGNPDLFFAEFLISVFYILDYTLPNIILP